MTQVHPQSRRRMGGRDPHQAHRKATPLGLLFDMAVAGVPLVWCLLVLALTPWVTVVGYETIGYRHSEQLLARARRGRGPVTAVAAGLAGSGSCAHGGSTN